MHYLRVIDANVIDFIKRDIFANELAVTSNNFYNFVVPVSDHRLRFNEGDSFNKSGMTKKTKKESKRVWESAFNEFVYWQSDCNVIVKNEGMIIPKTKYQIDYKNGRILFGKIYGRQLKGDEIITADFKKSIISVVPAYHERIESTNLPFIMIDNSTNRNEGFEIGGASERIAEYSLDVFTRTNGELKEFEGILIDKLEFGLKYILDFRKDSPLKELGVLNKSFKYKDIITKGTIRFENILSTKIRISDGTKNESFWSRITFTAIARTEILQSF